MVGRALRHQGFSNLGRAGEAELAHHRAGRQFPADQPGGARHHVQNAGGNAGLFGQAHQGQGCQGGLRRRLQDDCASRRQGRRDLARDHGGREIPGRDGRDHTDGLADHDKPAVSAVAGDDFAVEALTLFGEPFDVASGIGDLAARFGQRLALLASQDQRQVLLGRRHGVEPSSQNPGPIARCPRPPTGQRRLGRSDGRRHLVDAQAGNQTQCLSARRIGHGDAGLADPGASNPALLAQQVRIVQQMPHLWITYGKAALSDHFDRDFAQS